MGEQRRGAKERPQRRIAPQVKTCPTKEKEETPFSLSRMKTMFFNTCQT
jgi:hypothetical protein